MGCRGQAHQPCCNVPGACTWQSTPRHYAQSAYCTYVQRMQASSVMLCALRLAIAHGRARLHSRCLLRRLRHKAALGLVTHGLASGYACNEHGLFVLWLRDSCIPWLSWHVCCYTLPATGCAGWPYQQLLTVMCGVFAGDWHPLGAFQQRLECKTPIQTCWTSLNRLRTFQQHQRSSSMA